MKVGLFLGMCHIFLISRGLQKNSLLSLPVIYRHHRGRELGKNTQKSECNGSM